MEKENMFAIKTYDGSRFAPQSEHSFKGLGSLQEVGAGRTNLLATARFD